MQNQIFYHIYPLGVLGAAKENDFISAPSQKIKKLVPWLEHLADLGCTALYLGPVFESTSHGYDTTDYLQVDRRLGTNAQLKELVFKAHDLGVKVLFDGVFNHVGRDFWAFKDLQQKGKDSSYVRWFSSVDFSQKGSHGDGFTYNGWHGHYQLVELNLENKEVREYLFYVVSTWMDEYRIDGLRLDAADVMDLDFLKALVIFCKTKKRDFWLLGEVVFGDYRKWVRKAGLDSVTNYEYHTPLTNSFNQCDFNHISRILARQFGPNGVYKNLNLYSFVDNHDVDRAASALLEPAHLFPLYLLLFSLPGIPSIYNGSEWGFEGKVMDGKHDALRPEINLKKLGGDAKHPLLLDAIKRFAQLRSTIRCLQTGNYQELLVNKEQFVFERAQDVNYVLCAINASKDTVLIKIPAAQYTSTTYKDVLNTTDTYEVKDGFLNFKIYPNWGCVLVPLTS